MEVFWPAQVNFQSQQTTSTIQLSLTTTLGRSLDQYQSSLLLWNQSRNNTKNYYRHIPALPNHPQVVLHGRYGDGNLRKNNSVALEVVSGISETFKIFWAQFNFSLDPFNHNPEQEALVTPPTSSESKSGSPAAFSLTSSCSHTLRWSEDYFVRSLGSLAPTRNLENESVYDVRVLATNRLGNSNFSKVFNFYVKTTREPQFDRKKICNEAFFLQLLWQTLPARGSSRLRRRRSKSPQLLHQTRTRLLLHFFSSSCSWWEIEQEISANFSQFGANSWSSNVSCGQTK